MAWSDAARAAALMARRAHLKAEAKPPAGITFKKFTGKGMSRNAITVRRHKTYKAGAELRRIAIELKKLKI